MDRQKSPQETTSFSENQWRVLRHKHIRKYIYIGTYIRKYVISTQFSLSPRATGLYSSSEGNLNTTKSFWYSFKVCKNKILFFPWVWVYGTFALPYPAEELNPCWIQPLLAALIKCMAPTPWGFLGLSQAWPLRHKRQVEAVLQSSSQRDTQKGLPLTTLTGRPEQEWRTTSQPWVSSPQGKCSNLRKKFSGQPRELSPEHSLQTSLLYLSCWNVKNNQFTARLGSWPVCAGWQRRSSIRKASQDLLHQVEARAEAEEGDCPGVLSSHPPKPPRTQGATLHIT